MQVARVSGPVLAAGAHQRHLPHLGARWGLGRGGRAWITDFSGCRVSASNSPPPHSSWPESPRWLISVSPLDDASAVVRKMAKANLGKVGPQPTSLPPILTNFKGQRVSLLTAPLPTLFLLMTFTLHMLPTACSGHSGGTSTAPRYWYSGEGGFTLPRPGTVCGLSFFKSACN